MKKITEETLNAIQENVRTRETQELDYKRDNLFKGSWKDFKIADLQPNLIPDGWESFEPYGNEGEETKAPLEVFEENYTKNLLVNTIFKEPIKDWTLHPAISIENISNGEISVSQTGTSYPRIYQTLNVSQDDKYYMSVEYFINDNKTFKKVELAKDTSNFGGAVAIDNDNEIEQGKWTLLSGVSENMTHFTLRNEVYDGDETTFISWRKPNLVNLTKIFGRGNEPDKEWCDNNLKYYANWNDIPEEDKPVRAWDNMLVGITSLGNGLTRIQTRGGSNEMKLVSPDFGQLVDEGTDLTISLLVDNRSSSTVRFSNNLSIGGEPYPDGVKYMITVPPNFKDIAYLKGEMVRGTVKLDVRTTGDVDMIVSEPEIVLGHEHNPVLVVDELDDGRGHVQVYGTTKDTKLVYSGNEGFIGEDYGLKTTIENNGIDLDLSTSLTEEKKRIEKGENKVNLQGELSTKLSIEIGVPSE